ncbi:MAG: hypothetical protein EP340_07250 [Alphaproteobacteria bacterium]|nr:MAG: hypothetical protein EP340_07250 [Alphaproteobacteria bacterium]
MRPNFWQIAATTALLSIAACDPKTDEVSTETLAPAQISTEIVIPGSEFHGIHGLTFGEDGMIYVGSVVGMSIYRVNPNTGAVELFEGPPDGQADDLEFNTDGALAWTSFLLGKLHIRDADGTIRVLADNLYGINSLAFNAQGRLFASQVFLGDALYEFDPSGETPPRKIIEGMGGLNGFDFGPDGKLYGPLWFKGQIVRVDVETGALEVIVEGLNVPAAANFDSHGNLYTIDNETGEIFEIDIENKSATLVATAPTNLDNLAFDEDDRLFVTNMSDNGIYEVNTNTGEIRLVVAGPLTTPGGISYDKGVIYVADTFSLSKVDPLGGDVSDISRIISDHEYPTEVDATGAHIMTTSFNAGFVQAYDKESETRVSRWTGFNGPTGVLELEEGSVLVGETGTSQLLRVSGHNGEIREVVASELNGITDIARFSDDEVIVAAHLLGEVIKVNLTTGEKTVLASDLIQPEGVAVEPDGRILVTEVGLRRLVRIDPATGDVSEVVGDLPVGLPGYPLAPPSFIMSGITVSPEGDIFLASDIDNSILKVVSN